MASSPTLASPSSEDGLRHLTLRRSSPADKSEVASPERIQLSFSQQPQNRSTSITLTNQAGTAITLGAVTEDANDNRTFSAALENPIPAGAYQVAWRTMADDGHVIRGEFTFSVSGQ